ncbi:uncharacterized protein LOC110978393 [Acanthaster planci]|uniref:Uncharacterized protein LOC110978393 n=1 Tax=Acanthaster planci TaxID=133434 RepID=A0A8B7Y763_ACAPL|nr:uncharacterized protein LOC110978393 [Acanthaster planci]
MLKMPRQTGAFPPVNNLLQKKWNAKAYKQHLEKRKSVKTSLNTKTPKSYLHLQLNLKKIQLEEQRQEAIDQENRILLAKLTKVIRSAGQLDNWNEDYDELPKSLNRPHMLREQERIAAENDKISKRLLSVTAEYNVDQWEDDYLLHEYYLTLKAQETKSFEVETRGFEEDEPHFYNRDQEVATANGSVHQSEPGQTETEEQVDQVSISPSGTSKNKTVVNKKAPTIFRRPKPQPKLPLLGHSRKKEEEKRKREAASKPAPYDDKEDAARLFKATKGMTKAETAFIHTLARRTYSQRQQTKEIFEKHYELDLEVELIEVLGDEWTDIISILLAKREMIDATALRQALKGELPLTDTVMGLLCTRNNAAISVIKKAYAKEYGTQLADDIKSETKGQLRHLFLAVAKGTRMEGSEIDPDRAKQDAEILNTESEEERWKADTGKLAELLRIASFSQIREVLEQYEQLYGRRVMDEIQQQLGGDYRDALQAMVKCLYHCAMYMAERFRISLVRQNSPSLIRLVITRSEIDMPQIRKAYRQRYGETLMDAISSICQEPYKKALINMVLVHGCPANQQDQQEGETRGAFSATKVPSLPKVTSPANKTKPVRRPSPNKTATLSPTNPLVKSVKAAQQQQQPPAKESILVSRRPGAVPKKTVTVVDPRAKQTPPSSGGKPSAIRQSPSKGKRPVLGSKVALSSPNKTSRKPSVEKKEKRISGTPRILKTDSQASLKTEDPKAHETQEKPDSQEIISTSRGTDNRDGSVVREKSAGGVDTSEVQPNMNVAQGTRSSEKSGPEDKVAENVDEDSSRKSVPQTEEGQTAVVDEGSSQKDVPQTGEGQTIIDNKNDEKAVVTQTNEEGQTQAEKQAILQSNGTQQVKPNPEADDGKKAAGSTIKLENAEDGSKEAGRNEKETE